MVPNKEHHELVVFGSEKQEKKNEKRRRELPRSSFASNENESVFFMAIQRIKKKSKGGDPQTHQSLLPLCE